MMRPHLRAFMPGQTSLEKRIAANSLRSRSSCQASSEMFSNAIVRAVPALLTRMSTPPRSAVIFSCAFAMSEAFETSQT